MRVPAVLEARTGPTTSVSSCYLPAASTILRERSARLVGHLRRFVRQEATTMDVDVDTHLLRIRSGATILEGVLAAKGYGFGVEMSREGWRELSFNPSRTPTARRGRHTVAERLRLHGGCRRRAQVVSDEFGSRREGTRPWK
jgi:hypothetical protein